MATATSITYSPIARMEHLDRLAVLPDEPIATPGWDDVHDAVQAALAELDADVRRLVAGVLVNAGRTRGDCFFLFSYRTFSIPRSKTDPVVAGITFAPAQTGASLDAAVSGEQTGDIIASLPAATVECARESLLAAAHESARKLRGTAHAIAAALTDPSRTVD